MVNETGADNAEVLRRRANGLPVDADLMQRVRAQNEKNKASKQDPDGNEVLQGGARKDAKSSTAVSPKDRWNRIRRMRSINRGMTLASQLRGDAAVPALAVPLNPTQELVRNRLRDLDVALDNLLQLEEAMAHRGHTKIDWIKRMQDVATSLNQRSTERLISLAHRDETDAILNRDGVAEQFGLID